MRMFSSDKNIETISQLIQLIKHSIGLQGEYLKLDIMEKTVRIITALLLFAILMLIVIAIFVFPFHVCGHRNWRSHWLSCIIWDYRGILHHNIHIVSCFQKELD